MVGEKTLLKIVAILCISLLEAIALMRGIDKGLFGLTVAAIAGLAGYSIGKFLSRK